MQRYTPCVHAATLADPARQPAAVSHRPRQAKSNPSSISLLLPYSQFGVSEAHFVRSAQLQPAAAAAAVPVPNRVCARPHRALAV